MPSRRLLPRSAAPGPGRWSGLSRPRGTSCPWAPSVPGGGPYAAGRLCGIFLESTSPPKPPAGNASAEPASVSPFRGVSFCNTGPRDRNVIQPERRGGSSTPRADFRSHSRARGQRSDEEWPPESGWARKPPLASVLEPVRHARCGFVRMRDSLCRMLSAPLWMTIGDKATRHPR